MIQTIWHLVQKRRNSEARMRSRRDEVHDNEDVELGLLEPMIRKENTYLLMRNWTSFEDVMFVVTCRQPAKMEKTIFGGGTARSAGAPSVPPRRFQVM